MFKTIFAVSLSTMALAGAAYAQDNAGPSKGDWETTLSGNGTSNNDFDNHTFSVTGSAGKYLSDHALVGVRQSLNFVDVENGDDQTNFSTRLFADYVFDMGRWRPFVGVNFGGIYGENVNDTFAAGPEIGVKYYADQHTFVYLQGEYQFTFRDADNATDAADDGCASGACGVPWADRPQAGEPGRS